MITLHTSIILLSNLIRYRYNINTYSMYCRFKHIKYWVPQRLNPSINCELFCWGENSYQIRQTPRKQNKVKMFFFLLEMQVAVYIRTARRGHCTCRRIPDQGLFMLTFPIDRSIRMHGNAKCTSDSM